MRVFLTSLPDRHAVCESQVDRPPLDGVPIDVGPGQVGAFVDIHQVFSRVEVSQGEQ